MKTSEDYPSKKFNSQYRSITISLLSRVFERLVHNQMSRQLENNNILTSYEFGFRQGHSCITALVGVLEDIRQHVDCGNGISK